MEERSLVSSKRAEGESADTGRSFGNCHHGFRGQIDVMADLMCVCYLYISLRRLGQKPA